MLHGILRKHIISVHKAGILSPAKGHAVIAGFRNPRILLMHNVDPVILGCFPIQYCGSAILAAVIHHNDLQPLPGLPLHALQATGNGLFSIPHGDHHAHQGLIHAITPYLPYCFSTETIPVIVPCALCLVNLCPKMKNPSTFAEGLYADD